MDKRELQKLSQPTVDVYLGIEEQMLLNIAKRLSKYDSLLIDDDIEAWQTKALNELGALSDENIRFLSSQSGKTSEEIKKALNKAGYGSLIDNEDVLQEGVEAGKLNEAPPINESTALAGILGAYEAQALNKFNMINTTMLDQSQQAYLNIVNRTTGQVLSGASTAREALRQTTGEWAEIGVPALVDKAGKRWSAEGYVSMVTRTISNDVANSMQDTRMDEFGADLVEISSHAGARPLCAPFQGRIYSRSGNSENYPPLSETSYGQLAGIRGVNCGHIFYPFIEGISKQRYKPRDPEVNDRQYENSQKQRYLERRIRYAKREESMLKEMGDTEGAEIAHRKMLDRQANQRQFIKSTGRTRRYSREKVH
ncbi:Phage minor capsid protein 2 [Virgibacillus subterraneus]|uniref:Phage minor capsid protein 2 n=1 Tax=Virgibacillus subterraneus TaxID=621109 RepID=A0A1H8YY53_9BACI|nr:phage minor capsid protein [Virgibacillus subterraneus]SEP57036.1 Phage minor capsid protein 2 [Virgibacillus subterraneus]